MSVNSEIERLQGAKSALKTAIEGKGVSVPASTKLDGYPALVDSIEQSGGGGGGTTAKPNDVEFIDYDGTIVASYSAAEFANLAALPGNPDHTADGLVSQGWNWTLSNAKTYVASYGKIIIGQMYTTDDGATRITIDANEWSDLSFSLTFSQNVSDGVTVNWGDGSSSETMSGTGSKTFNHTFPSRNIYTISLLPGSNCTLTMSYSSSSGMFGSYTTYKNLYNTICSVHIGSRVTSIGSYAFYRCYSLRSVTIPSNVTSIESNAFGDCYCLPSITIPNSTTSLNGFGGCHCLCSVSIPNSVTSLGSSVFQNCYSLKTIIIPNSVTNIGGSTFYYCYSLSSVVLPNTITSIGGYAFHSCYALKEINLSDNITSIGNSAFQSCYSLTSIHIPNRITSIEYNLFNDCYSLQTITLPSSVTNISSGAFRGCHCLRSVTISSGVTKLSDNAFYDCDALQSLVIPSTITSIGTATIYNCYGLKSLTIPSSVTSIGTYGIYQCYQLNCLIFERTTPPTLGGASNSLGATSETFPIFVPDSAVTSYKSRYANYASRIKGISEREYTVKCFININTL